MLDPELKQEFSKIHKSLATIEDDIESLARSTAEGFEAVDIRFESMDARFEAVDARLEAVDSRFEAMDTRFEAMDTRFDRIDTKLQSQIDLIFDTKAGKTEVASLRAQVRNLRPT